MSEGAEGPAEALELELQPEPDELVLDARSSNEGEDGDDEEHVELVVPTHEAVELSASDNKLGVEARFSGLSKAQAKATLSKKDYKRWKKWKKAQKGSKQTESKRSGKSRGAEPVADAHTAGDLPPLPQPTQRRKRVRVADGPTEDFEPAAAPAAPRANARRGPTKVGPRTSGQQLQVLAQQKQEAARVVASMAEANKADATTTPAIHRLLLRPTVVAVCQQPALHPFLVEAGLLDQLCSWLCDKAKGELAPIDLRSSAIDLLLGFDFEGVASVRKKMKAAVAARRKSDDLTDVYEGITAHQLRRSHIGECINFVRTHPAETKENKAKATTLLERMCRTYYEENDEEDVIVEGAKWPFMDVQGIASPFETVKTETEAFQANCIRIDPEDPLSYLRQPPTRYPKSFITGLFDVTQLAGEVE